LPEVGQPAYARFFRRVRALAIDSILLSLVLAATVAVVVASGSEVIARTLGFALLLGILLYEPVLVSMTGGTVGHYLSNLRVVDNRSNDNLGFWRAALRAVVKALLGWFSFISMATTRRHQAVHDVLTGSSVRIRDLAKAQPQHYLGERFELASPAMPSHVRRVAVIAVYLVGVSVLCIAAWLALAYAGTFTSICIDQERCSPFERNLMNALVFAWLAAGILCVIFGWRGRLPLARRGPAAI
jgi:hypothetical protein